MLDKSVPYEDILMHRPIGEHLPLPKLPDGYTFCLYRPGDEVDWARIETSVLEFPDEMSALLHFKREFTPVTREMCRRCLFIHAPNGEKVATATAFWDYIGVRRVAMLHWVAVKPAYQGKGLGKAIVALAMQLIIDIEGECDIYLHTQTWSHKAVAIYKKAGFKLTAQSGICGGTYTRYDQAMRVLNALP